MDIRELTDERILYFDGGMGTMLQGKGLGAAGELSEDYNLTCGETVTEIHREYVAAGAEAVTANTFQANRIKLGNDQKVEECITAGVECARASGAKYVALDVGPLGRLMAPMGPLTFREAYGCFRVQAAAGEKAGADLIVIETMSDLYEVKAALLAAKENTSLPVVCTLSYQESGRTFLGCDPVTATVVLQSLGADAVGVNCSLGPQEMMPVVEQILQYASVPVIVQANAGLPQVEDGRTVYPVSPEQFARDVAGMVEKGVRIVGGCCGTTPDFIRALRAATADIPLLPPRPLRVAAVTSGTETALLNRDPVLVSSGLCADRDREVAGAVYDEDWESLGFLAIDLSEDARILGLSLDLPGVDMASALPEAVRAVQGMTARPLQISSADFAALEAAARIYNGRPILHWTGPIPADESLFRLARRYGGMLRCRAAELDADPGDQLAAAKSLLARAAACGLTAEELLIDCTCASRERTLAAARLVARELGAGTAVSPGPGWDYEGFQVL